MLLFVLGSAKNIVAQVIENVLAVANVEKRTFHFLQFCDAAGTAKKKR